MLHLRHGTCHEYLLLPRREAQHGSVDYHRWMTAKEFLDLSTKLFSDMKAWIAEAGKAADLSPSDLAMLNASMKIIERVTLKEAERKPDTAN
jgi:ribosome-binding protein aMBF1 (putative translation factor)